VFASLDGPERTRDAQGSSQPQRWTIPPHGSRVWLMFGWERAGRGRGLTCTRGFLVGLQRASSVPLVHDIERGSTGSGSVRRNRSRPVMGRASPVVVVRKQRTDESPSGFLPVGSPLEFVLGTEEHGSRGGRWRRSCADSRVRDPFRLRKKGPLEPRTVRGFLSASRSLCRSLPPGGGTLRAHPLLCHLSRLRPRPRQWPDREAGSVGTSAGDGAVWRPCNPRSAR
jgi:hypothetical protein